MESSSLEEIEELALCACCKRAFDDERPPKVLACKHHFCLACARLVLGRGLCCVLCWQRTVGSAELLPTQQPVLALAAEPCELHALPELWCGLCSVRGCRACVPHVQHAHELRPPLEAHVQMARDSRQLRAELQWLTTRRRDVLVRALDAATALKLRLETELAAAPPPPAPHAPTLEAAAEHREKLRARLAAAAALSRADELVRGAREPLDRELLRRELGGVAEPPRAARRDPLLFLANYCTAQMYARQLTDVARVAEAADEASSASPSTCNATAASSTPPPPRPRSVFPLFYFHLEVDGTPFGRVVIEVRSDVAPRMARNFGLLAAGQPGAGSRGFAGYRGCTVFRCWRLESVITGDFELNNGRGGRSVFEESYFMPEETGLAAVRGAVGMRRGQRRRGGQGLVGSQFRIVLRDKPGSSAIFAAVVEGLELVDRLSRTGDAAGKPRCTIVIASCGKLN